MAAGTSIDDLLNSYSGKPASNPPSNKASDVDKAPVKKDTEIPSGGIDTKQYREGISSGIKSLEQNREDRRKIPDALPPTITPPPKQTQTDPMQTFGSSASFLATFGSLLTKRPLISALNAGAAVQEAVNKKDAQAYKTAFDSWKAETENAWKMADWSRNNLKDMYERLKDDRADLSTEMELFAKMTNDPTLEHMTKAMELKTHIAQLDKNTNDLKKSLENQQLSHDLMMDDVEKWKKENSVSEDGQIPPEVFHQAQLNAKRQVEAKGSSANVSDLAEEAIQQKAKGIVDGLSASQVGLGYGDKANRTAVYNYIAKNYPDADLAKAKVQLTGDMQEARSIATRSAPAKIAVKEIDKLADPMVDAVKKIDPTKFPTWTKVENAYEKGTGGPDVVAAYLAVQEFKVGFTSLMVRNGVPTDSARARADELINVNMSLPQIKAVVKQAKVTGAAVLDALSEARGELTGKSSKKPDKKHIQMLKDDPSAENKAYFDEAFGDGSAAEILGE